MKQFIKVCTVLAIVFSLTSCNTTIKPKSTPNEFESYGNVPLHGIAEVTVNGKKINPYEFLRTMSQSQFDLMTNDQLYGYKVVLTQEELSSLQENRRLALEATTEPTSLAEKSVKFYRNGEEVNLADALKEYSPEEVKKLFTSEERVIIFESLTQEQLLLLTPEQTSALQTP